MIYVFTGSDRAKIDAEIKRILGTDYEVFDGENLKLSDFMNIFLGTSLFAKERKILLKDIAELDPYEEISKYLDTPHTVVIWETKPSQKKAYKDFIKSPNVKAQKIDLVEKVNPRRVFDIYDTALCDGPAAVKILEEIKEKQDPYMFFGLMVSQAIKKYEYRQGGRERKALKELAKLDMQMKSTAVEPWILIEGFLLRLSSL